MNPEMKTNKPITIAIADDHKQMRTAICDYLNRMGFDVIMEAKDGKDLLSQLESAQTLPDICVLDYRMPGMTGDELATIIGKKYPAIKMAAMTTNMDTDCLLRMLAGGCGSYLVKSSSPAEWKTAIEGLNAEGYHCTDWMAKTLIEYVRDNCSELVKYN